ncbi:MAG: HlyC/CorC family transporter [Chromatiales bacterium]|nr:HlyC/CorC family transporter [Chromatiales bacterium]
MTLVSTAGRRTPLSEDVPLGLLGGLVVLLLFISAFFSGTETALMTINRYRLRHKAGQGHRGARLTHRLLQRPELLISLILFGNNLVNIMAASLVTVIALRLGGPGAIAIGSLALTVILLLFAEITPKTLAALHPERLAFPAAYVYYPLLKLSKPLIWLLSLIATGILRLFGVRARPDDESQLTIDELRTLVNEAGALLPRRRQRMLLGILELEDIMVDDVMIPHTEVTGIDLDQPWPAVMSAIRSSPHSRLPLWRGSIDQVVGVLRLTRLVQDTALDMLDHAGLQALADEPYFVPEGTSLQKQLMQFRRARQRTAFVVDEYGDIQGIVTLEDILEEILGEFSSQAEAPFPDVQPELDRNSWLVNAGANIRALNRMMGWRLPTDGPRTLNGLVIERMERIPGRGAVLEIHGYRIEIVSSGGSTVKKVRISSTGSGDAVPAD